MRIRKNSENIKSTVLSSSPSEKGFEIVVTPIVTDTKTFSSSVINQNGISDMLLNEEKSIVTNLVNTAEDDDSDDFGECDESLVDDELCENAGT